jgi:hypothetical protein
MAELLTTSSLLFLQEIGPDLVMHYCSNIGVLQGTISTCVISTRITEKAYVNIESGTEARAWGHRVGQATEATHSPGQKASRDSLGAQLSITCTAGEPVHGSILNSH